jgi:Protein of unknown function (DUF3297)
MVDTPPDRLCVEPKSPFYDETVLARGVGIRFGGKTRTDVVEYSVSEGWIRISIEKSRDRFGNPLSIKLKGVVEPFFEDAK